MIIVVKMRVRMDEKTCISLTRALEPDNRSAPRGVSISMECDSQGLVCVVECRNTSILTCRNTVDDILEHAATALKLVERLDHAFKSRHIP